MNDEIPKWFFDKNIRRDRTTHIKRRNRLQNRILVFFLIVPYKFDSIFHREKSPQSLDHKFSQDSEQDGQRSKEVKEIKRV